MWSFRWPLNTHVGTVRPELSNVIDMQKACHVTTLSVMREWLDVRVYSMQSGTYGGYSGYSGYGDLLALAVEFSRSTN